MLVCGDKAGAVQVEFYRQLIKTADARYADHLAWLKEDDARKKTEAKKPKK